MQIGCKIACNGTWFNNRSLARIETNQPQPNHEPWTTATPRSWICIRLARTDSLSSRFILGYWRSSMGKNRRATSMVAHTLPSLGLLTSTKEQCSSYSRQHEYYNHAKRGKEDHIGMNITIKVIFTSAWLSLVPWMHQILTSSATFFAARFDRKAYSW
jgi:hypothetical protein